MRSCHNCGATEDKFPFARECTHPPALVPTTLPMQQLLDLPQASLAIARCFPLVRVSRLSVARLPFVLLARRWPCRTFVPAEIPLIGGHILKSGRSTSMMRFCVGCAIHQARRRCSPRVLSCVSSRYLAARLRVLTIVQGLDRAIAFPSAPRKRREELLLAPHEETVESDCRKFAFLSQGML